MSRYSITTGLRHLGRDMRICRIPVYLPRKTIIRLHSSTGSRAEPNRKCWHCGAEVPRNSIFCPAEPKLIQPPPANQSYYDILVPDVSPSEVPFAYDIDEKKMKRRFLQVQRDVHPDGFGRKSKTEQQCADLQSSLLNKAFQTLRDPLSRAKYLLSLNHLSLAEHEGLSDPHLLMEVMEIREALEEASSQHEVDNIKTENDQRIAETVQRLSDAFRSHDLEIAKKLTAQLQYWMNIKNVIRDWAPGKRIDLQH